MSVPGTVDTKPLVLVSHSEAVAILQHLGSEPLPSNCPFMLSEYNGSRLLNINSVEELRSIGVTPSKDYDLQTIFRNIQNFQMYGVPAEFLPASSATPGSHTMNRESAYGFTMPEEEKKPYWQRQPVNQTSECLLRCREATRCFIMIFAIPTFCWCCTFGCNDAGDFKCCFMDC